MKLKVSRRTLKGGRDRYYLVFKGEFLSGPYKTPNEAKSRACEWVMDGVECYA